MKALMCVLFATVVLGATASAQTITVPRGGLIVAEGDSLTYGQDMVAATRPALPGVCCARAGTSWPEALAARLGVTVENRGSPGDRTVEGLIRWQDKPAGTLVILAYGTNDAINAASYPTGTLSLDSFRRMLTLLATRRREAGARVVLMTPFPATDATLDARIEPYRQVIREVGQVLGCRVVEGPKLMPLGVAGHSDGVHLNTLGYQTAGDNLARSFQVR